VSTINTTPEIIIVTYNWTISVIAMHMLTLLILCLSYGFGHEIERTQQYLSYVAKKSNNHAEYESDGEPILRELVINRELIKNKEKIQ